MQGAKSCRVYFLLLICLWLVGCGVAPTPALTPTPLLVEVPVQVPIEVTRIVTQQVTQQIIATPTPAAPCATTTSGEGAVVTVGAILPLSSPGALLAGFAMQTALNIAVTDINEQGGVLGVPLRLVTYDSAGIPERAAQFAERLIVLDCAVGILGLYHNGDALAVTDVAHRYGIPVIVSEAASDDITARGYPEIFRVAPAYSMLAQIPANWLVEVGDYNADGVVAATIIAENSNNVSTLVEAMREHLLAADIEVELLRVDLPATDFSPVIARLVTHEQLPDALFIVIKGDPALLLQSQLLEAGIGPQRATLIVQQHAGLNSAHFWHEVPNGNGTVVLRQGAWASTITERGQDFAIKYDQYLARWPESYAFAAYDSLWLLANALTTAPTWRSADIIATLAQSNATFTSGTITFAADSSGPPYQWQQWLDSQILYLQYTEPNQAASAMSVIWPPQHRAPTLHTAVIPTTP